MIIIYYPHGTWRIISFPKEDQEGDRRAVCGKILWGRGLDGENLAQSSYDWKSQKF